MSALPGYTLSPSTAVRVKQLVQQAPDTSGAPSSDIPRRQCGWVRCTSSTATSGWFPGIVVTQVAGTWTDADTGCQLQEVNGSACQSGTRYWCECAGDDGSGVTRYVVTAGGSTLLVVQTSAANDGTQWTPALLYGVSSLTGENSGFAGETVDVKPVAGPLRSGVVYCCVDTGARTPAFGDPGGGPYTGRRRFRTVTTTLTEVITEQVCDSTTGTTTNRDRMIPTI